MAYRSVAWRLLVIIALLLAVMLAVVVVQTMGNTNAVNRANLAVKKANAAIATVIFDEHVLRQQAVQECVRVNIQRVSANRASAAEYAAERAALPTLEGITRYATAQRRQQATRLLTFTKREVASRQWTPLTNCVLAVAVSGRFYRSPTPIPFVRRMPPSSATDVQNAQRVSPVGSALGGG